MQKRRWIPVAFSFVLSALAAGQADGQVFTPTFQPPRQTGDLGVYLSDLGDLALEGIWRRDGVALRAGVAEFDPGSAVLLGAQYQQPLRLEGSEPLALAWTLGAQGIFGDVDAIGIQGGLTIGGTLTADDLTLTPYIHPRIAFIDGLGQDDDSDLEVLADMGVDLDVARNLIVRFGINLGEGADWGIGVAWRR